MVNAKGGADIGGKKYKIEIVALDDKNDPKVSVTNAEKLTSQGIKYIIGPNIDTTALAVKPVMERSKALKLPVRVSRRSSTRHRPMHRCSAWSRATRSGRSCTTT